MKRWVLFLSSVLLMQWAAAQNIQKPEPPYKRFPSVPPIQLQQLDSSMLTKDKLKKQPLILMFFSPTCDHCQHQIEEMVKNMDKLSQYQIVLASYSPKEEMEDFYKDYKLANYSNIKMGRDIKYLLPPFYDIRNLPYLALYNKKGDLITTFEGNVKVAKLLEALK
ncbi:redoxin domain-containing protein [Pseudoflavitalea sp. G-6-1-2]|uniref:TlpA family protein disulfide reductase n=1 Tax=Pseudoflavitalea sp. G-6-1-2 TaxID=2728841 RepID=UPI00146BF0D6|nr:redoxin domain-containing protein [Pseudoflavitalea sp. G-6-1-2]NML20973.1 redoxin domain-containing protein [Pseudoflavitalea sp. G-6-1-2]